jgi:vacuolar protein-sorting-associated protein 4
MQNTFTPQAVEIVKQAIDLDNLGEYEKALGLYRRALEFFMTGLKYEQNPAARKMILERVDGYMKRAEEIKNVLASTSGPPPSKDGGGGAKTMNKNDAKNGKGDDDEQAKMRGALSSAIVSEKPNVKWDDVAGLEGAKEALKEGLHPFSSRLCRKIYSPCPFVVYYAAVVLPTKFPQVEYLV